MFDRRDREEIEKLLRQNLDIDEAILRTLWRIEQMLSHPPQQFPTSFIIKETSMALQQPDPGATLQFTATPQPSGSTLGTVVPTWTSSDTTNVTITTDPTGLIASVVLAAAIPVGEVVTLTINATNPATSAVATGSTTFTVGAPPPPPPVFPSSFAIAQTA